MWNYELDPEFRRSISCVQWCGNRNYRLTVRPVQNFSWRMNRFWLEWKMRLLFSLSLNLPSRLKGSMIWTLKR